MSRSPTGRSSASPTKSLLDSETSTGQPVATSSSRRRVRSSESWVVLPKSWAGSITMLSRATPAASARSAYAVVSAIALATTSAYSIRCGRVRGATPPVWVQMMRDVVLRGHVDQGRVGAAPGVVEHVGAGLADSPADLGTPGVDADHHVGVGAAHPLDEAHRAPHLLLDVDLLTGRSLDAADVDDLGTLVDDLRDPVERLVLRPRRALVVEGVRGAVDDRHHQPPVVGEGVPAEAERHASNPPTWSDQVDRGRALDERDLAADGLDRRSPTLRGWSSETWSGADSGGPAAGGGQDLHGHAPRSRSAWCRCARRPRSTCAIASGPSSRRVSIEGGQLDGVPGRDREPLEQVAAYGPLAGQRMHQPAQLGPLQRDQRTGHQLGHPAALERRPPPRVVTLGALVEALHQGDAVVGEQRSEQAAHEVGVPVDQVGVHEHDQVAARDEQRLPHRLALAAGGCPGRDGSRGSGARPRRRRSPHRRSRRSSRSR